MVLLGLVARPVPPAVIEALMGLAVRRLHARCPAMFARLRPLADKVILIDPVDLPFRAALRLGARPPSVRVGRDDDPMPAAAAVISAPLPLLIDLLEGRADGDALFFSRDLAIEGDTEAVLLLRNAVDGAGIDVLEALLATLGPLSGPARRLVGVGHDLVERLVRDLEAVRLALIAPKARR